MYNNEIITDHVSVWPDGQAQGESKHVPPKPGQCDLKTSHGDPSTFDDDYKINGQHCNKVC